MSKKSIVLSVCTVLLLIALCAYAFWNGMTVARLSGELDMANAHAAALNQQNTNLTAQLSAMTAERDALSLQLADEKSAASSAQTTLNAQLSDLSTQLTDEKTASAAAQATLTQQAADLSAQLKEEQSASAALQTKLDAANAQIAQLEKDVLTQQSAANVAQAKCDVLTEQLSKATADHTAAAGELSRARTEIASLQTQLVASQKDASALKKELDDAQKEVAELASQNSALSTTNAQLKQEKQDLSLSLSARTADISTRDKQIETLNLQLEAAQADNAALQTENAAFVSEVSALTSQLEAAKNAKNTAVQLEGMSGTFINQFIGMSCPIDAEDIDIITGATVTCNAVVDLINNSYKHLLNAAEVNNRQLDAAYVHSTLAIGTAEALVDNVSVIVGIDENGKTTFVTLNPSLSPVAAPFTAKCDDPEYLAGFTGLSYLTEPNDIHVMTGATFTSRAIAEAINNAYENAGALGRSIDVIHSFCPEESLAVEGGEMRFAVHFDQSGSILHIDSYGADERTQAYLDSLVGLDPYGLEMRGDDGVYPSGAILEMILEFLHDSVL